VAAHSRACRERNDFVMIVALDPPDFRTISDFHKRHLKALGELFLSSKPITHRQRSTLTPRSLSRTNSRSAAAIRANWCPLVEAIENNLGRKPEQASADSGYCRKPNLEALVARGIDGYVAPGRAKHPAAATEKLVDR
jgi:hypothetical protein